MDFLDDNLPLNLPLANSSIIKVIGVGGGGGNAVNHMYNQGIADVSFVVCNTDNQDLVRSPVPIKVQLGKNITQGLGAGGRPEVARQAAEESVEDIRRMLADNTKMVFIAAYADDRVFRDGHWYYHEAADEWKSIHHVAGGHFYTIGDAVNISTLKDTE